jgi:hypothetical protein
MINPILKKGDRVILLHMEKEMLSPGLHGTVTRAVRDPFEKDGMIYEMKWDDDSTLSLVSVTDAWTKIESEQIIESNFEQAKWFIENSDIPKNFNTHFLTKYLIKLRDSGIVNMFGAAPYLWMGKERIEHEHHYDSTIEYNEDYDDLLEMADQSQREMINGVIKVLESKGVETSVENINRYLKRYDSKITQYYMNILS